MTEANPTIADRFAMSFFSAITGALYGVLLWLVAFYFTHSYHPSIIAWSVGVFGVLGIFFGNFILEALLALLHFLWGAIMGFSVFSIHGWLAETWAFFDENTSKHLKAFVLVGFGTGLVIGFWWFV